MTAITSSGASDTDRARNCTSGWTGQDALEDGLAASAGEMDVEEHDVGHPLVDQLDGRLDLVGLADHLDRVAQLGPHPGPEHGVVVDQEDPGRPRARPLIASQLRRRGMESSTSAPLPGGRPDDRRTAEAGHPGPDGLGDALVILGDGVGVEPAAAVADEEHDDVALHLGIEGDLGARRTTWRR